MKIGFIGTGNMGTAIIKGYLSSQKQEASNIFVYDRDEEKMKELVKQTGISQCNSLDELIEKSQMIVIAVKPGIFDLLIPEISPYLTEEKIIVSIAAGIGMSYIEKLAGKDCLKVVRVMPNTPAMVNEGMTAICKNEKVSDSDFSVAIKLFEAVGKVEVVSENLIDAVIGVSGSSPAYAYMFIQALIEGAVKNGIEPEKAKVFAAQSVLGAAKMVLETGIDPVTLRENVCSPGGTTIEAVHTLQGNGFMENVIEGMEAAISKSKKMTKI